MKRVKKKHLEEVGKQLLKILKRYSPDNERGLDEDSAHAVIMRELGFRRSRQGTNGAWINKESCYVVKSSYLCSFERGKKTPKKAIPTAIISDRKFGKVFVQPLADTSRPAVQEAYKIIKKEERKSDSVKFATRWGDDAHDGNIGLYQSRPVVFDW